MIGPGGPRSARMAMEGQALAGPSALLRAGDKSKHRFNDLPSWSRRQRPHVVVWAVLKCVNGSLLEPLARGLFA